MAFGIINMKRIGQSTMFSVELADVSNASATATSKKVALTWDDPSDVSLEGATVARWAGTLVVRKAGSAPMDKDDGTIVINSTTRNAYSTTPLQDTSLENGVTYYYRFFPYSQNKTYTTGTSISARPAAAQINLPVVDADFTYDGNTKTPALTYDTAHVQVSGDTSGTNAGSYSMVFSLNSDDYIWSDGTYTNKTVNWSIGQADGGVSISADTVELNTTKTYDTLTISQIGDGKLSVESGDSSLVVGTISGTTLTVTRIGTNTGTCQLTVKAAASTNYTAAQITFNVTVQNYKTMTVKIDESNSNPETCCTYADDALDMEVGSAEWDTFFGHYPCLMANGVEGVKLNPNNFEQDINGNTVDITSGNAGDVMVAFPRHGLKMSKTGTVVTISMTDDPNDPDFEYMAHKRGSTLKDKFYIGAYMGSEVSSKLRSLKGKTIANSKSLGAFRTLAQANGKSNGSGGSGYDQHGYYQLTYLIAMYCLKYKNLNSQSVIGRGFLNGNSAQKATGGTEAKGMDWGETTGKDHMKLFGIEDLWGNVWSWIDGLWYDSNHHIWTATENFNSDGSGYTDRGASGATANLGWGYSTKIVGTTHGGFLTLNTSNGSETTYYCDRCKLNVSCLLALGGRWNNGSTAGVFCLDVSNGASATNESIGSRLMYL